MVKRISTTFLLMFSLMLLAQAQVAYPGNGGPRSGANSQLSGVNTTAEGIIPDTTALRWMGFSDGGEVVFFKTDTTNLIYTEAMVGSGSSYNAIFMHPDGRLIVLIDSTYGVGDRNFYEYQPFMSTRQLVHNTSAQYLASACVLPNGRVFGITGNGISAPGQIYEYDFANQVDSLFMTIPYSITGTVAVNILYHPTSDKLLVFNGGIDTVFAIDYHTKTYQEVNANLNLDGNLKATYLDGEKLVLASNGLYLGDLSQNYDIHPSPTTIPDYFTDLDNLDLIKGSDTIYVCAGDSAVLESRFQSPFVHWFMDSIATNNTNPTYIVTASGNYRLLVQIDGSAARYMWSEVVTVIQTPSPIATIALSNDSVNVGQSVTFMNTGTLGNAAWDFGDGATATADSTTHSYSSAGTYVVTLTVNVNGCISTSYDTLVVLPIVGVNPSLGMQSFIWTIAPNPASDRVAISLEVTESMPVQVEVLDLVGSRVAVLHQGTMQAGNAKLLLDAGNLAEGVYMVKVSTEQGQQVRKLVVQH